MCKEKNELKQILEKIKNLGDGYIVSKQLIDGFNVGDIDYVFVGDNPGAHENNSGEYLSNKNTKKNFEAFLKDYLHTSRKKCLILNKSLLQTKNTKQLSGLVNNDNSQKLVAQLISKIVYFNDKCTVVLMGWTDFFKMDGKSVFRNFYSGISNLLSDKKTKSRFVAYRHPSRGMLFTNDEQKTIGNYIKSTKKKIEFFKYYGLLQLKRRMPEMNIESVINDYRSSKNE